MEKITREGRSRKARKEVVGCIQSAVGKKNFLVQFEDGQKKEISYSHLVFLSSKGEVDIDEAISHSPGEKQGEVLNIVRASDVVKP